MKYLIPEGKHQSKPSGNRLSVGRKTFHRWVRFDASARYMLPGADHFDLNKLFGVGYLPHHHYHSARFAWRYTILTGRVELWAYCYINGKRIEQFLCNTTIGEKYKCALHVSDHAYSFYVFEPNGTYAIGSTHIDKPKIWRVGYWLGPYFGGNLPAPHDLTLYLW